MDEATLRALGAFPDQLAAHFALFPAAYRHWAPASWDGVPSEALTALEQVCHRRAIRQREHLAADVSQREQHERALPQPGMGQDQARVGQLQLAVE